MRVCGSTRYIRVSCHFQHRDSAILGWGGHWCLCSILFQPLHSAGQYSVLSIPIFARRQHRVRKSKKVCTFWL